MLWFRKKVLQSISVTPLTSASSSSSTPPPPFARAKTIDSSSRLVRVQMSTKFHHLNHQNDFHCFLKFILECGLCAGICVQSTCTTLANQRFSTHYEIIAIPKRLTQPDFRSPSRWCARQSDVFCFIIAQPCFSKKEGVPLSKPVTFNLTFSPLCVCDNQNFKPFKIDHRHDFDEPPKRQSLPVWTVLLPQSAFYVIIYLHEPHAQPYEQEW